ncbi:hypothetical protein ACXR2U_04185, partial [Jatrophihabitans sp. YIM 134969]
MGGWRTVWAGFALSGVAAALLGSAGPSAARTAGAVPVGTATAEAVGAATADGTRVAVAVTDTTTGATRVAGEHAALFPSESVVKVLIATRLLVDRQLTGEAADQAAAMLSASDDEAANRLWGLVGGADVVAWVAQRYGLTGLGAPSEWGWWGNTQVSATGLTALYAALAADPVVAPFLLRHLGAVTTVAADGTDQSFGFAATDAADPVALKQGWGGDDDAQVTANLLSTGYLADGRYGVAVIVQDPAGGPPSALVPTIDSVAAAVVADTVRTLDREAARSTGAGAEPAGAAT